MTEYRPLGGTGKDGRSLLEKAADRYDLSNISNLSQTIDKEALPIESQKVVEPQEAVVTPNLSMLQNIADVAIEADQQAVENANRSAEPTETQQTTKAKHRRPTSQPVQEIDRDALRDANFIVPDGPVTGLSEEFRIVKRQLLSHVSSSRKGDFDSLANRILICSAQSGEGKTFCAINLALSIAAEQDYNVLLIDADIAKPGASSIFGLRRQAGLMDALSNDQYDMADLIVPTDIPGFSILPAGNRTNLDTEFLASARTGEVLDQLADEDPRRIMIFDSPPALAASPASELASHVGQALMIVRADKTSETALRDALSLVARCDKIQLMLNGVKFSATGRSFGSYYGYGEE
ncbi:AAA family ATPase [Parasphingorhabdus sp. DH2-15]|uniref:AAA family ATPase n=1 Tax=Parasphingorhabdus sp. DH2-15 TaxID=3444112 RepID=UPI003F687B9D